MILNLSLIVLYVDLWLALTAVRVCHAGVDSVEALENELHILEKRKAEREGK